MRSAELSAADAIRYLAHEARECRGRDALEMHALLYPAILRVLALAPMEEFEAAAFRERFKQELRRVP